MPAYAAVDDAVEACKRAGGRGVAGFANALLRRLSRVGEPALPDPVTNPEQHLLANGFPAWLVKLLLAELPPPEAIAFAASAVAPAPVTIRAQASRVSREALLEKLVTERPDAVLAASSLAPDAIDARHLEGIAATTAWRDGLFAVQDAGAQVVVELCGAAPGERILDACAGSGGKTAHLLSLAGDRARVDAVDLSSDKLAETAQSLRRLGLAGATFVQADLTKPLPDPSPRYHRILLDAPCSGLGVLRRHPESLASPVAERSREAGRATAPDAGRRRPRAAPGRPADLRRLHVRAAGV